MSYRIPRVNPHDPEDLFCIYCQIQFKQLGRMRNHVIAKHGEGLAKRLGLVPVTDEERRRIEQGPP